MAAGRWSEGFGCGVNGLAGGYGVRRNIDRSAMRTSLKDALTWPMLRDPKVIEHLNT
jgi:hypothetical protein